MRSGRPAPRIRRPRRDRRAECRSTATSASPEFHDDTTHTPQSIRTSGHTLEWDIKPFPFKIYTDLSPLALPREVDPLGADALAALGAGEFPAASRMTLEHLATLLYFAAGVTRKKTYPGGGEVLFRAAPSTGALYQTEVYVAVGDVEWTPGSITSLRATSRCAGCARATCGRRWPKPPPNLP